MGGRGGAWQSRKPSFCCCVLLFPPLFSFAISLKPVCVCVRVAYLLSPPLSLIPLFCLPFACTSTPSLHFPPLPLRSRKGRFSLLIKNTQSLSSPSSLAGCFSFLLPTCVLPCSSQLPFELSLAETCIANSGLWQAGRHKMKAQSSKMHQHEY